MSAFRELAERDGLHSFYKGMKMALIATMASFSCYFFCYRAMKNLVTSFFKMKESQLYSGHIMGITALSGAASSAFANPFWFTNTRMTLAQEKKSIR